jgi:hypothetical protein
MLDPLAKLQISSAHLFKVFGDRCRIVSSLAALKTASSSSSAIARSPRRLALFQAGSL